MLFDGTEIAASGTLTVSGDHTLQAYADDQFQCALTVTLTDGITGTPAAGTCNYPQGTVITTVTRWKTGTTTWRYSWTAKWSTTAAPSTWRKATR